MKKKIITIWQNNTFIIIIVVVLQLLFLQSLPKVLALHFCIENSRIVKAFTAGL